MKAALVQMVSAADVSVNLQSLAQSLAQAAQGGAELVVLPEYFCLMGQKDTDKLAIAEPDGAGPIQATLAELSRQHSLWLVAGSMPLQVPHDPHKVTNSCLVFNPHGDVVARYDKMHLFFFDNGVERYDEARVQQAGQTPVCFDLPSRDGHTWRVGLSICFDVRFPALYQQLTQMGAHVLLVPSAFTHTTGAAHWSTLMQARALDNLAWLGAAAQGGTHDNGRRTWGHSMWVDPWGQVVTCLPSGPGCVQVDLDMQVLRERRAQLPAVVPQSR